MTYEKKTYLFQGKLAQFHHAADHPQLWEERWASVDLEKEHRWATQGRLGLFQKPFLHHLPTQGLIVEAGCGTGRIVHALHALGYQVIGLDWAEKTINRSKKIWPDAAFIVGDVRGFPLAQSSVAAVISLGVIEHFLRPWDILEETMRILCPGGILYLVLPYVNLIRHWKMHRGKYPARTDSEGFYQFLLTEKEIQSALTSLGFRIIEHFSTSGYAGLVDEWPQIGKFIRKLPASHRLINALNRLRGLGKICGHVVHYVAYKTPIRENAELPA